MDFPPFMMVYHKLAKSPFLAEPKQYDAGFGVPGKANFYHLNLGIG